MSIRLETSPSKGLVDLLSDLKGSQMNGNTLRLPAAFGQGYVKLFTLGFHIDLMIHDYELADDVTLTRTIPFKENDRITFSFRHVFQPKDKPAIDELHRASKRAASVQVSSGDVALEFFYPAGTRINTLLLTVDVAELTHWLAPQRSHPIVQTILTNNQSYLFEELVSPAIQQVANQLVMADPSEVLHNFYLTIKSQEIICLFFGELLKRRDASSYSINAADSKKVYWLKDKILADLSVPPNLPALAQLLGMSESKMKRLFKQIFGNSIYQYYQTFRLNEAAHLIKDQNLSISETGYRLGFSNLSHFSRIFEQHVGVKPKKYAMTTVTY